MDLIKKDIKPRDIMTREAFENAITVDMGIGGSSNTVLHLTAIAHEAGIDLPAPLFDEISRRTPYITKLSPAGKHHMTDLNEAGGIPAVMHELSKKGLIHLDALTITGTVGDRIKTPRSSTARSSTASMTRTARRAASPSSRATSHRTTPSSRFGCRSDMLTYTGKAKCYNSETEACDAIMAGEIHDGDVVVIRYEGPKGGPGMQEMLNPTASSRAAASRSA